MEYRNPLLVFFLTILTAGIYSLFWFVKTSDEMNRKGASIPAPLLIIIPFINLYWLWTYAQGVTIVAGLRNPIENFLLIIFLGPIGMAIIQNDFNKIYSAR